MFITYRLIGSCLIVLCLFSVLVAQNQKPVVGEQRTAPIVTAAAATERVRFAAPGSTVQMQLEVFTSAGEKVFAASQAGNVLDWAVQDKAGQPLADGSYLCVVRVKSLSGKVSQKLGTLIVQDKQLAMQAVDAAQLTPALSQSLLANQLTEIGSTLEGVTALTVLSEGEADAVTTVAHDGIKGEIGRSRGGLSFRLGDFFSGKDKEQMVLTEEGNLGIGTAKPKARLDVAGTIRAREGFAFSDGSTLNVSDKGALTLTNSNGTITPNVAGTGTQNRLAKWTDNGGTLGDSVALDTGTGLQLTAAPSGGVDTNLLYLNSTNGTTGMLAGSTPSYGAANGPFFAMRGNTYSTIANQRGLFTIAAGNVANPAGDDGSVKFNTGNDQLGMVIRPTGNIGIGTAAPAAKLDVAGNINTTTQYNIGGDRVLSAPGSFNMFAGRSAGAANTTGLQNAFFGSTAGLKNTTGQDNTFVGNGAGLNTTTTGQANASIDKTAGLNITPAASSNTFVGSLSGLSNMAGSNNTIIGMSANVGSGNLNNATAIGANAVVNSNNTMVLGTNAVTVQVPGHLNVSGNGAIDGNLTVTGTLAANLPGGSGNYIQNGTNQQAGSDFNISGNGTAGNTLSGNIVNTTTQYNIGGNRVLSAPGSNIFAGFFAGGANTTGSHNSFFGTGAGFSNTGGAGNSFFGTIAGQLNTEGQSNSFFGDSAGSSNLTGIENSFFGAFAGLNNTADLNSFFGAGAGQANTVGGANTFIGGSAGSLNTDGIGNTYIGYDAGGTEHLVNATAIGAYAVVNQSNSLILGGSALGLINVGIGTDAPKARLHIAVNGGNVLLGNAGCSVPFTGIGFGTLLSGCTNYSLLGNGTDTIINRPSGGTIFFRENNTNQMSIDPGGPVHVLGTVTIDTLGAAGAVQLCRNGSNQIATCSSSLRYKKDVARFAGGLDIVNRLRPITFTWKDHPERDLGFGAEDVAAVEPLLVTHNAKGEIEGVKYDRLSAVLINAVQQQQLQIKSLQARNTAAQYENTALKARLDRLEQALGELQLTATQRQTRKRRSKERQNDSAALPLRVSTRSD